MTGAALKSRSTSLQEAERGWSRYNVKTLTDASRTLAVLIDSQLRPICSSPGVLICRATMNTGEKLLSAYISHKSRRFAAAARLSAFP